MTDNNKAGGFWTTLPGLLTGIAGLLGGIVAVVQVVKASYLPSPTLLAQFAVEAKSPAGTPFFNEGNKALNLRYEAKKSSWVVIPEGNKNENLPKAIKGDIALAGLGNFAANNDSMKCSGLPLGALIVVSEKEGCLVSGAEDQFTLLSGDTVRFLMNDVEGLYQDNVGSASINLYKVN
jgi:hypothetical protein